MFKKIWNQKWKILIVVLIGLGIYYYFFVQTTNQAKIETSIVKMGDLKEELTLSGTIDADEHTTLRFATSGRLTWVGVKEGQYVKKYQSVASLDSRDTKKILEKYLNTFASNRLDFDQGKYDNTILTNDMSLAIREKAERALQKSQYDLNNSVLNVELQNIALEYSNLWTPIEGLVVRVNAPNAGINITPTSAEFEIINPKTVYLSATVDQNDVVNLKEKMPGKVILDPYPDNEINSQISNISFIPKTGETGTVYEIKMPLTIDNSKYNYRFGMTGDATFTTKERNNVLYLPTKFVKTDNGKKYVNLLKNNIKEKKYVKTGMETDTQIEIMSGLSLNDKVSYE